MTSVFHLLKQREFGERCEEVEVQIIKKKKKKKKKKNDAGELEGSNDGERRKAEKLTGALSQVGALVYIVQNKALSPCKCRSVLIVLCQWLLTPESAPVEPCVVESKWAH